ncbi:DUF6193 family natural product biosynthesis protein [Streptomyces griseus]|uniref:DUF6193 family natural product biosynthesis protein n=1 Tax=Streptomyces griseus TaxID=1911 RepID=UPI0033F9EC1E
MWSVYVIIDEGQASTSTPWPYARDVATAHPLFQGGYRVFRDSDRTELGEVDTVEEAYALLAPHPPRPPGWSRRAVAEPAVAEPGPRRSGQRPRQPWHPGRLP